MATKEDIPLLLRFSKNFMDNSPYRVMKFDRAKTQEFLTSSIEDAGLSRLVLCALKEGNVVGFIVGMVAEPVFSSNRLSMELAWWVEPNHRGSRGSLLLYSAYEDWAKRVGCSHVQGAYLPGVSPDLDGFYKKRGYVQTESSYVKVLKV